jgi:hypothetical protein
MLPTICGQVIRLDLQASPRAKQCFGICEMMVDQYAMRHVLRSTLVGSRRSSGAHAWDDHTSLAVQGIRLSPHVLDGMYLGAVGEHGDRRYEEDIGGMQHASEVDHGGVE